MADRGRLSPRAIVLIAVTWVRKISPGDVISALRTTTSFCHGIVTALRRLFGMDRRPSHPSPPRAIAPATCDVAPQPPPSPSAEPVQEPPPISESAGQITREVDIIITPDTPTFQLASSSGCSGFFTTAPDPLFQRYERNVIIEKNAVNTTLEPNTRSFARDDPEGWTAHMHPEGALYYAHNTMNIFTDSPLHQKPALEIALSFIHKIDGCGGIPADEEVDLVLDIVTGKDGMPACGYYLADHRRRIIFWYDVFELARLWRFHEVHGVRSPHHIKMELTAQYWYHCTLFPSALTVSRELVCELRDVVAYSIGDSITAMTSTVGYPVDDLLKMLTVTESLKENTSTDVCYGGTACIISRFMWSFACRKFYDFHGEPCARLEKEHSVFGYKPTRSLLFHILGPLLFNAPLAHLHALESVYVDEIAYVAPWGRISDTLCLEWQELILYATVLLNADVAFLAIPTVDDGGHMTSRSTSQIAGYVSLISSLGSVIIGLILVRQSRKRKEDEIDVVATFLGRHYNGRFGFESLALLHSIPFALLMWGAIAFLSAFLAMCFQHSDTAARSLVAFLTMLSLVFGVLWFPPFSSIPLMRNIRTRVGVIRERLVWRRGSAGSSV
ncbi:hypothetical protein B0H13DRAFT_1994490 [Mycena leptocephala]|nr:hypothetical protein B0H13DRAFT_1994490 [Mycena leptocephala]